MGESDKVKNIVANSEAFAAHTVNGCVYCSGNPDFGGDKNDGELMFIENVVGSTSAFAAKRMNEYHFISKEQGQQIIGDIIIWGDRSSIEEAEENLIKLYK